MVLKVCIGSACHVKGSYYVIEAIKDIIKKEFLEGKVELKACFCLNDCLEGVSLSIEGSNKVYNLTKDGARDTIMSILKEANL